MEETDTQDSGLQQTGMHPTINTEDEESRYSDITWDSDSESSLEDLDSLSYQQEIQPGPRWSLSENGVPHDKGIMIKRTHNTENTTSIRERNDSSEQNETGFDTIHLPQLPDTDEARVASTAILTAKLDGPVDGLNRSAVGNNPSVSRVLAVDKRPLLDNRTKVDCGLSVDGLGRSLSDNRPSVSNDLVLDSRLPLKKRFPLGNGYSAIGKTSVDDNGSPVVTGSSIDDGPTMTNGLSRSSGFFMDGKPPLDNRPSTNDWPTFKSPSFEDKRSSSDWEMLDGRRPSLNQRSVVTNASLFSQESSGSSGPFVNQRPAGTNGPVMSQGSSVTDEPSLRERPLTINGPVLSERPLGTNEPSSNPRLSENNWSPGEGRLTTGNEPSWEELLTGNAITFNDMLTLDERLSVGYRHLAGRGTPDDYMYVEPDDIGILFDSRSSTDDEPSEDSEFPVDLSRPMNYKTSADSGPSLVSDQGTSVSGWSDSPTGLWGAQGASVSGRPSMVSGLWGGPGTSVVGGPSMESDQWEDHMPAVDYGHVVTSRTFVSEQEMQNELDKIFETLDEGDKTTEAESDKAIASELYPHQKQALNWMICQENNEVLPPFWVKKGDLYINTLTKHRRGYKPKSVCGGILADDMGLGKTLEMISLIMTNCVDGKPLAQCVQGRRRAPLTFAGKSPSKSASTTKLDSGVFGKSIKLENIQSELDCSRSTEGSRSPLSVRLMSSQNQVDTVEDAGERLSEACYLDTQDKVKIKMEPIDDSSPMDFDSTNLKQTSPSGEDFDNIDLKRASPSGKNPLKRPAQFSNDLRDEVPLSSPVKRQTVDLPDEDGMEVTQHSSPTESSTGVSDTNDDDNDDDNNDDGSDGEDEEVSQLKAKQGTENPDQVNTHTQQTTDKDVKTSVVWEIPTEQDRHSSRASTSDNDQSEVIDVDAIPDSELPIVINDSDDELPDIYSPPSNSSSKENIDISAQHSGTLEMSHHRPYLDQSRATLIICPKSVISNWVDQFEAHVDKSVHLKLHVYYGTTRSREVDFLKDHDVIITTYPTLASDFKSIETSPLHQIEWLRIVLDEGHSIRNPAAKQSKAIYELRAERRWVLTGTPIQNSMKDLWSIINFLQVEPFTEKHLWNRTISRPIAKRERPALKRVARLMGTLAMRRTKNQQLNGKPLIELPAREVYLEKITLSQEERDVYEAMQKDGKVIIGRYFRQGTLLHHYGQVLTILLRLRQLCCHPLLIAGAVKKTMENNQAGAFDDLVPQGSESSDEGSEELSEEERKKLIDQLMLVLSSGSDEDCSICLDSLKTPVITQCAHIYCRPCIEAVIEKEEPKPVCPLCRREVDKNKLIDVPPETRQDVDQGAEADGEDPEEWQSSAKVDALMKALNELRQQDPGIKSVIVSQFTSLLKVLETPLGMQGFKFARLDGSMNVNARREALEIFADTKPGSPTIFLLSLKAGGVGINLTAASRVFLMDPAWNPAAEDQCFDRCHRLGQTKDVIITKFVIEASIEEKMLEIQERKRQLMQGAFTKRATAGQRRDNLINDIRRLINI